MRLTGVDVGGTFTDIVFADTETGQILIHKVPTTQDGPSQGVVAGIGELCSRSDLRREAIDHVLHGTTIGTDAAVLAMLDKNRDSQDRYRVYTNAKNTYYNFGSAMSVTSLAICRRSRAASRTAPR